MASRDQTNTARLADNNVFTNLMAQRNCCGRRRRPTTTPTGGAELNVDVEETASWRDAAQAMLVPYDSEHRNPTPRPRDSAQHQAWDFESTTPEQYPLLFHFPYFDLYRKPGRQAADLVLALHVRGDAFSDEEKARNFAYYERFDRPRPRRCPPARKTVIRRRGRPLLELAYDLPCEAA